jgi:DnaA-homolog protein
MQQLPLSLGGLGPPSFDNYLAPTGSLAPHRLRRIAHAPDASRLLLTGPAGVGKSHLLMACCEDARAHGHTALYCPLPGGAGMLAEGVAVELLAIDALDAACGDREAEFLVFTAINRQHDARHGLLMASSRPAEDFVLPDLRSRLAEAEQLVIDAPDDEARVAVLLHRASRAGLPLEAAAAQWLLRNTSRALPDLLATLARLDRESLARGRRITVPLLREVLGAEPGIRGSGE